MKPSRKDICGGGGGGAKPGRDSRGGAKVGSEEAVTSGVREERGGG